MNKSFKKIISAVIFVMMMLFIAAIPVLASGDTDTVADTAVSTEVSTEETKDNALGDKAMAAAIAVGLAAAGGAVGMGLAIAKSVEGISRQPEADNKIRTTLMLGLVFVETAIIYALVVAILVIFVL